MTDRDLHPVTVLGLGPMGQALAGALLTAGHPTTVWNRTAARADPLVARGARRASTVAEAVRASPLVLACVLDYAAVRAIVEPAAGALAGRALVNLTADTPQRAREMAAWASGQGVDYLDGAIMTPAPTIGGSEALVLYSGPEQVWHTHRDILLSLGGSADWLGADPARAAAHDVALLDVFWTAMSGIAHAFALARAEGITATEIAPYVKGISGLLPDLVDDLAGRIDVGNHTADVSTIASAAATMTHIVEAAEGHGIDTGTLRAANAVVARAVHAGHGDDDFSRLVRVYAEASA
ncbi:NAD(P)-dependent oxidoreductase [Micromonospora peucetia]|uniref:3-hydroxyisobutyrate dehydrogenase n=1 Tax=Micromonospora peucetia TaxID=47871 RepID=A0A1C6W196_9ACTN|nr:NAD(P)-binding domain-containing protein [Micromonospora peucetia]WSA31884.1 NAD(P)-binding domain-containing protein [Micromonospora peucetia]SCL72296.1 3-hydroxyisobutyrate dehydrogenase [Micromonospora peucetia]